MNLIAISGKRRSGKSALGSILQVQYGYYPISIAAPLKDMCQRQFGLTTDQTDGVFKEQPTQYRDQRHPGRGLFLTPRDIMTHMGAAYRTVDKDYWVKKLFDQIKERAQAQMQTYVITDVRFRNEMEWMKRHGAVAVRLARDEKFTGANLNDASETDLDTYLDWDLNIPAEKNVEMDDLYETAGLIHDLILARA